MSDKSGLPTGKHTLVEDGTEFKGTMSSNCPIVVMGKVEGELSGPVIHITPSGVVAGIVKVKELRSDGELAGEVEADSVQISGRVRDRTTIRARTLEVSLTAQKGGMQVMFGECELAVGDEPNKEAAVAAAMAVPPPSPPEPPKPMASTSKGAAAATTTATAESEEAAKRRRGTQPPPGTPSAS
jgi:cytoskeletal protein CcmA (bactofilin family)